MVRKFGDFRNNPLYGSSDKDSLFGLSGDDNLVGFDGDDVLSGGAGNDVLSGGAGKDYLQGTDKSKTNEVDVYFGGAGEDVFALGFERKSFYRGEGFALIKDFDYRDDFIAIKGSTSRYQLVRGNWVGDAAKDTAILLGGDIIGIVQDSSNVKLSRDFLSL